jgi:hypothetical protein
MDLGTIKDKLKKNQYSSLSQVGADVRLVWTNCMTYNQDGSDFYKLADSLHRKWDDKFSKLLQEVGGGGGGTPAGGAAAASSGGAAAASAGDKVTLKEKRDFAKQLFALTKEDLGKVLVEVEARCPLAIVRNATEDEVELNVDHITAPVLQELSKFVETAAKAKGGKKKAGAGAGAASSKKARAESRKRRAAGDTQRSEAKESWKIREF